MGSRCVLVVLLMLTSVPSANASGLDTNTRRARPFALRARTLAPYGVASAPATGGVELSVRPWWWAELTFGADTNGLMQGLDAGLNLLPLALFRSGVDKLCPFLGGSLQFARFTAATEDVLVDLVPMLGRSGVAGESMTSLKLELGLDYVGTSGFAMQFGVGRVLQLGDSRGEGSVVFSGWQSWALDAAFGYSW